MKLATLCYVQNNGKTLMLHRIKKENDYHEGKWNGLGGKFEPGETPEECARREVEEESGLVPLKLSLKGFITFPLFDGKDDWYVFLYTIDEFTGKQKISDEGVLEWVPTEKVTDLNLWDGDKIFLDWVFANRFFSAKFVYVNGEFMDYEVEFY